MQNFKKITWLLVSAAGYFSANIFAQIPAPDQTDYLDVRCGSYETKTWNNWANTIRSKPKNTFYPKTKEEVIWIIKEACKSKMPVRFCGTSHSYSTLVSTDGFLINTDKFDKVLSIDQKKCQIKVEGGIKIKNLVKILADKGLALPVQGYITAQSIAGATATGTHGSGKVGTLSDYIIGMEIINGKGVLDSFVEEDTHPTLMAALRVNLGALGFVYSVTLQCEPLFVLEHTRTLMPWNQIMPSYMNFFKSNDFFMIMSHPLSSQALVYTWKRTNKAPTNNTLINLKHDIINSSILTYLGIQAAHWVPGLTNKFVESIFSEMQMPLHREYSYKSLSPIKDPQPVSNYIESEIAIPIENFPQAIADVNNLYTQYKSIGFELVGMMLCRFTLASDRTLVGQNYERDTAYICLATLSLFPAYEQFYTDLQSIMLKYGGRPHWGKLNYLNKNIVDKLYSKNADIFCHVRETFDPQGIFSNAFIKKCFE